MYKKFSLTKLFMMFYGNQTFINKYMEIFVNYIFVNQTFLHLGEIP